MEVRMKKSEEDRWKKLEVWKLSDDFAFQIYMISRKFPREEMYGIKAQLRRAALSVPTNIVEGYSRRSDKELVRFLDIAIGSLEECKYLLHFSARLKYLGKTDYQDLASQASKVGGKLWKFYKKIGKDI